MFRMLGKKAELIRYRVTYAENGQEMTEGCISEQHKNEVEQSLAERGIAFTTVSVDQSANEWFNGLEFDSYDEAMAEFNAGQADYEQKKQQAELTNNLKLRADVDYLAIMSGVEI